ncbi:MAG: helix-turn-helix domain-containing protein [Clostridia bacterium]|nr:helix-turn-helix domain-containing protein [Clostridia bacterium]MBO5128457.1 helix-turn-helix domain-containing protein [Clostridia bacterium]
MNKWIFSAKYHDTGQDALYSRQHAHDDLCELLWCVNGSGSILIGDALYSLEPNRLYFIPSLMLHYTHPADPDCYIRSKLLFSHSNIRKVLSACNGLPLLEHLERTFWSVECPPETSRELDHLFCEAVSLYERETSMADDIRCVGLLLRLLAHLAELYVPEKSSIRRTDDLLNRVLIYINAHLFENLTLDQIADHCHISKFHLCHRFREEINMTIMQYIADQRILSAKIALLETDKSISTVAMENGYANFSHFCSAFRRAEGISPASFRKQYRQ